jgi:hypothetical protein
MSASPNPAAAATAKWKRLAGVYKTFFTVSAYPHVERWYNEVASLQERHALKTLVKEILAFDMSSAIAKAGKATCDPEITLANAIVSEHGGELLSDSCRRRAVEYVSMCHPAKRELYRRIFGLIIRPSNFCAMRHMEELDPARCYVQTEASLIPKKKLIGEEHLHHKSHTLTLPMHAQTGNKTHYQQNFVWKFGSVPLAYSQRAVDRREAQLAQQQEDMELLDAVHDHMKSGVTTAFVAPAKAKKEKTPELTKAPDGPPDLMPSPWGLLNTGNVDGTQWESVTHDMFKHTYFLQPKDKRLFQNLNDNYSRMVYLTRRKLKKEEKMRALAAARSPIATSEVGGMKATMADSPPAAGSLRSASALEQTAGVTKRGTSFSGSAGARRSASTSCGGPSSITSVTQWLDAKGKRPVSIIFPSI